WYDRNDCLCYLVRGAALNGQGDNFSRTGLGLFAGLLLNGANTTCRLGTHLIFNTSQQEFAGLLLGEPCDALKLVELFEFDLFQLFTYLLDRTFTRCELAITLLQGLDLPFE